jgi:hypothetical protein
VIQGNVERVLDHDQPWKRQLIAHLPDHTALSGEKCR